MVVLPIVSISPAAIAAYVFLPFLSESWECYDIMCGTPTQLSSQIGSYQWTQQNMVPV